MQFENAWSFRLKAVVSAVFCWWVIAAGVAQASDIVTYRLKETGPKLPDLQLFLEKEGAARDIRDLVLDISDPEDIPEEASGGLGNMSVQAVLRFTAAGEEFSVRPDQCVTPEAFGARFAAEGYSAEHDLVCVVCCDGGNFALTPMFDEDGGLDYYRLTLNFRALSDGSVAGLRVDGSPEAYRVNAETSEPLFNELRPASGPRSASVPLYPIN